jgi:hypothetical protein
VSTRRGARNAKRGDSIGRSAGPVSREKFDSRVTVLEIKRALAELGILARLSDIVAKKTSRTELSNRVRAVSRSKCAE